MYAEHLIPVRHSWELHSPACGGGGYSAPANLSLIELAQCPEFHFTETCPKQQGKLDVT